MILLAIVVCFITVSICGTVIACSHTRLRHKYDMAQLEADRERRLLGDGR